MKTMIAGVVAGDRWLIQAAGDMGNRTDGCGN